MSKNVNYHWNQMKSALAWRRESITKVGSCGHQGALYKWTRSSVGGQPLQHMIKGVPPSVNRSVNYNRGIPMCPWVSAYTTWGIMSCCWKQLGMVGANNYVLRRSGSSQCGEWLKKGQIDRLGSWKLPTNATTGNAHGIKRLHYLLTYDGAVVKGGGKEASHGPV